MEEPRRTVAYFSIEVALDAAMPTYAGGLGVLAGDTIRAAADLSLPMAAVTLLHRKGYLEQELDSSGWQRERPCEWDVSAHLEALPARVTASIEGRKVHIAAWKLAVTGVSGAVVPVYFLDTDLPENSAWDRALTDFLYGGDAYYRICQEVVLGIGGVRMLRALGHKSLSRFHLNEGHASFLALELLDEQAAAAGRRSFEPQDIQAVRQQCVFTTHTPVAAGHDQFSMELVNRVLGRPELFDHKDVFCCEGVLNMTFLALNLSHYVNGVAKKHAEISRLMFARYKIDAITNGVHAMTWASEPFRRLFDRYITGWEADNFSLRFARSISREEIWEAHRTAKRQLLTMIQERTGTALDESVLTLGFARRATAYKRADLLFHDVQRLRSISRTAPLQLIYAGKAHPNDHAGKEMIQRIVELRQAMDERIRLVFLQNYDLTLARFLTAGVDVWLNTPQAPLEASGTSGMKAALNGVPSLSILDGWWIEGCIENHTGWAIGDANHLGNDHVHQSATDAAALYEKLERVIVPLFHHDRNSFIDVMRNTIALNGSFFNTHRMLQQYALKAYFG